MKTQFIAILVGIAAAAAIIAGYSSYQSSRDGLEVAFKYPPSGTNNSGGLSDNDHLADYNGLSYYNQLAANATKDNPFGLDAKVIYFQDSTAISCPIRPCGPFPGWALKIASDKPAWLLGYAVCDGPSSCRAEQIGDVIASAGTSGLENKTNFEMWSGIVIRWVNQQDGDPLPWKVGDKVNVIVNVEPAVMVEKNDTRQWQPAEGTSVNTGGTENQQEQLAVVTDLGETKIIKVQYGP